MNAGFLGVFRHAAIIAGKDLQSELRTKESFNAALAFSATILILFSFAIDPFSETLREMSGGLLWLVFAFAGALVLNRSFAREQANDCLDVLLASPASGAALFLGKAFANFALLLVVELISMPIFAVLYGMDLTVNPPLLAAVLALATWGMTVIGTIFSALTVNLRIRELMLPVLVYPMLIPVLMSAMKLTTLLLSATVFTNGDWLWFRLLVGFDIIFTAAALALVDSILVG
jgi:heme exporter protein B